MKLSIKWATKNKYPKHRIVLYEMYGVKNNMRVDIATPGAKIAINFLDRCVGLDLSYFPEDDEFYCGSFRLFEPRQDEFVAYDEENKKIVKGRLAELTGIVAEDPLSAGEVHHMTHDLIGKELYEA